MLRFQWLEKSRFTLAGQLKYKVAGRVGSAFLIVLSSSVGMDLLYGY